MRERTEAVSRSARRLCAAWGRKIVCACGMMLVGVLAYGGEVPGGRFTDLPGHDEGGSDDVILVISVLAALVVGGFFVYIYVQEHWETVKDILLGVAFIGVMVLVGMCGSASSKEHARERRAQEREETERREREREAAVRKARQKQQQQEQLDRLTTPSGGRSGVTTTGTRTRDDVWSVGVRTTRSRTVTYYEACKACGGRGKATCKVCGGTGMWEKTCTYCNGSGGHRRVKCSMCGGKGKRKDESFGEVNCLVCWGNGWVEEYCLSCFGSGKRSGMCDCILDMQGDGAVVTCTSCGGTGQVRRTRKETY